MSPHTLANTIFCKGVPSTVLDDETETNWQQISGQIDEATCAATQL
jgi:hypothetical protein